MRIEISENYDYVKETEFYEETTDLCRRRNFLAKVIFVEAEHFMNAICSSEAISEEV